MQLLFLLLILPSSLSLPLSGSISQQSFGSRYPLSTPSSSLNQMPPDYHHTDPPKFYEYPIQAEIGILTAKIAMGGNNARKALERLHAIANHVNMDGYMKAFLPVALACKSLLIRENEPWKNRYLCQSLMVRITNLPVTTQFADPAKGLDFGKESSIVVPRPSRLYRPDREVEKLRAGADLDHILDDKPLEY